MSKTFHVISVNRVVSRESDDRRNREDGARIIMRERESEVVPSGMHGAIVVDAVDGFGLNAQSPYGFERLERSVEFLIEEHQRLTAEREALLEELVEREQRVIALETQLKHERARRMTAVEGVDKILGRLEQLQASVVVAVETA